ncbi:cyclophilin-like fold protein [Spirosoma koreense]
MKLNRTLLLPLLLFFVGGMACKTDIPMAEEKPIKLDSTGTDTNPVRDSSSNRLRIRFGSHTFQATLLNNPTITAFKARLPLTLSMKELNGNEKFADLPTNLPTNAANPGTIQAGDLMLYGSNTLVLFYETFRTSYSYTKLGRIDNPTGLATALGSGTITVSLEMEL